MSVKYIHANDFETEIMNSKATVLVDFYADWCGPCRMIAPILEEIAEEKPNVKVCKINVDEEPDLAAKFGVMSIPALFVLKDGKITNQAVGAQPKARILDMLA